VPGETVEEQKPTVVAAASAAVEASAPVEPSPVQSPGQDEVCQFHSAVREKKRCRENGARKTQILNRRNKRRSSSLLCISAGIVCRVVRNVLHYVSN